jgi:type IV fimbrial biogenesis protein FimT
MYSWISIDGQLKNVNGTVLRIMLRDAVEEFTYGDPGAVPAGSETIRMAYLPCREYYRIVRDDQKRQQVEILRAGRWLPFGFTLIELMLALSILALLMLLGFPSFTTFLRNSEIRSMGESLLSGLRMARSDAITMNRSVLFTLDAGGWSTSYVNDDEEVVILQRFSRREVVNAVYDPTSGSIVFTGLGRVRAEESLPDYLRTIDIRSGEGTPLRVLVANDTRPVLKLCDPAIPVTDPLDSRACG